MSDFLGSFALDNNNKNPLVKFTIFENLSPFLFSLYLNDLEEFLVLNNVVGLRNVSEEVMLTFNILLRTFIILYADDTVLISDSATDLQHQLNVFYEYCNEWKLKVNIEKTKIMIFF